MVVPMMWATPVCNSVIFAAMMSMACCTTCSAVSEPFVCQSQHVRRGQSPKPQAKRVQVCVIV